MRTGELKKYLRFWSIFSHSSYTSSKTQIQFDIILYRHYYAPYQKSHIYSFDMKTLFWVILSLLLVLITSHSEYAVVDTFKNSSCIILTLQYRGNESYYIKPTSPIIKTLTFTIFLHTYYDLYFTITDAENKRFTIPSQSPFPKDPTENFSYPLSVSSYNFSYKTSPFDFMLVRSETGSVLFSTYDTNMIFSQHYMQIGTEIASEWIFGLGQRLSQGYRVRNGKWTMFSRDRGDVIDRGTGLQTYGYFPFYQLREKDNNFHMVYFRSSSATDVIKEEKKGKHHLTWKTIGGVINFRFFLDGSQNPEKNVNQMYDYSMGREGGPIPSFWTLGYHQSRWGYQNATVIQNVIKSFKKHDIPLDTLWSDLDYMVNSEVFTIDETRFPLKQMKDILKGHRWIPIIDPGLLNQGSTYEEGLKRNIFILDANSKQPFLGKMRVGRTAYPDFFHPNATTYWHDMLDKLYKKVPFSGVWIDSNEFTSFCVGRCEPPDTPSVFDYNTDLPYSPGSDDLEGDMISLNSTHYGGLQEADVHIYNGYLQILATYEFLQKKKQNDSAFILARSHSLGSNRWAAQWSGDNIANYEFLKTSISDIFNAGLFGYQMSGADICGFSSDTTPELCARWYQLGSLYPFSRNHNEKKAIDQQPYALGDLVLSSAKKNLKLRYSLLKQLYSTLVNQRGIGMFWKPLYMAFPKDERVYDDQVLDTQALIGNYLMVAPILEQGVSTRSVHFPENNWYCFFTGRLYRPGYSKIEENQPGDLVPLFLRQGYGVFVQDATNVSKTTELDNNIYQLVAALKKNETISNGTFSFYDASALIMGITDYSIDSSIAWCKAQNCYLRMNIELEINSGQKLLQIDVRGMDYIYVAITGVKLYIENEAIEKVLPEAMIISMEGRYIIPLGQSQKHIRTE